MMIEARTSGATQVCRRQVRFHLDRVRLTVRRLERRPDFSGRWESQYTILSKQKSMNYGGHTDGSVGVTGGDLSVAKAATSLSPGSSSRKLDCRLRTLPCALLWCAFRGDGAEACRGGKGSTSDGAIFLDCGSKC